MPERQFINLLCNYNCQADQTLLSAYRYFLSLVGKFTRETKLRPKGWLTMALVQRKLFAF